MRCLVIFWEDQVVMGPNRYFKEINMQYPDAFFCFLFVDK